MTINKIKGVRDRHTGELYIYVDSIKLDIDESRRLKDHSNEFNAGYMGSGPSQTALAILLYVLKKPELSMKLYHTFKALYLGEPEYYDQDFEFELDVRQWANLTALGY